jgi:hypothetical protein
MGEQYHKDCRAHVGRYVDQCVLYCMLVFERITDVANSDDKVEEGQLSDAFNATCRAWKARYGVPYTACGCQMPTNKASGPLSALKNAIRVSNTNTYETIISSTESGRQATHPSDHTAVSFKSNAGSESDKARREKAAKRLEKDYVDLQKGKVSINEFERRRKHEDEERPFLAPSSLIFGNESHISSPVIMTGDVVSAHSGNQVLRTNECFRVNALP